MHTKYVVGFLKVPTGSLYVDSEEPVGSSSSEDLLRKYLKHRAKTLSTVMQINGVYRSKVDDMTLSEFIVARQEFCKYYGHKESCDCKKLISAATHVLQNGFLPLKDWFCKHFGCNPSKFKSDKAVSRVMQLPVAVFPVQQCLGLFNA